MDNNIKTSKWDAAEFLESREDVEDYLQVAFESGDPKQITKALGNAAKAQGMIDIASKTGLTREHLYTSLSESGNPTLQTLRSMLFSESSLAKDDNHFAAVGAIILHNDKVLLVRHTYGGAKGKLLNPSGFIQQGEMPYEALKREVLEETGVEINPKGLLAVRCSIKDWWLVFLADYVSGTPRSDNNENSEVVFMPCEDAINHPDITDATKTLIKLAKEQKTLKLNDEYSKIPSSNGRVMFS